MVSALPPSLSLALVLWSLVLVSGFSLLSIQRFFSVTFFTSALHRNSSGKLTYVYSAVVVFVVVVAAVIVVRVALMFFLALSSPEGVESRH